MTRFVIGKGLDGPISLPPASALGELTTGPIQFLSWLESQVGLSQPEASFTSRTVEYLALLRGAAVGRFYERSLAQDEFGTARTLLRWRDDLYEAGWDGSAFPAGCSARLHDMAAVEALVGDALAPCVGERVQRAITAVQANRPNLELVLLDPPEAFPWVWQRLFSALGATEAVLSPVSKAAETTDLGRLQRALVQGRSTEDKLELVGDGSVLLLRDGSPQLSAPWIARFAHAQASGSQRIALLAMEGGTTLDDAFGDAGYPRLGYTDGSHRRPVLQVLSLVLELVWRPLDPAVLLQFLAHPMGPIPARIRRRLAQVVAQEPGIGGETWHAELQAALDDVVAGEPDDVRKAKREELASEIDVWLDGGRHDATAGAPVSTVIRRVHLVALWLARSLAVQGTSPEASLYAAAQAQAEELERILRRLEQGGTTLITRVNLRRLVDAVRGRGASRPGRHAQCAPTEPQLLRVDSPAGCIAAVQTMIWWACDAEHLPRQHPWSARERQQLADHGVRLLPLEVALRWQAGTWMRPIVNAEERLVLVLHDNADGHHPVIDTIVAVAEGWNEARVGEVMRDPARLQLPGPLPPTREVHARALAAKQRWWQLPPNAVLPAREQESYSSLETFLFGPYRWVLNYQARIRPGALEALDDGALLRGNLAHALFERFFEADAEIASLDAGEARRWVRDNAEALIEQQGAVLLAPGRQSEKEHWISTASNALGVLVDHLKSAGVVQVTMESALSGRFCGGGIGGSIDLLARKADGELAVVDLKWGRFEARRQSLVDSEYLQLAVYAQLVRQNAGKWPTLGLFVISDARLAVLDSDYFPGAVVERPANEESALEFWQRVEATWAWRRAQLDTGLVEVPVTGTERDPDIAPGDDALPLPETFDQYDDYVALTGWSQES